MRSSSTMIDSHNAVVAGASTLPAAVAQLWRSARRSVSPIDSGRTLNEWW